VKVTQPTNENQLVNNRHVTYAGEHYAYMNTSSRRNTSVRVDEKMLHIEYYTITRHFGSLATKFLLPNKQLA